MENLLFRLLRAIGPVTSATCLHTDILNLPTKLLHLCFSGLLFDEFKLCLSSVLSPEMNCTFLCFFRLSNMGLKVVLFPFGGFHHKASYQHQVFTVQDY